MSTQLESSLLAKWRDAFSAYRYALMADFPAKYQASVFRDTGDGGLLIDQNSWRLMPTQIAEGW